MAGHVFLVHGDLKKLACDSWLVPSGDLPRPGPHWRDAVANSGPDGTPRSWAERQSRVIHWDPLKSGDPRPWVVCTINYEGAAAAEFVRPAVEYLRIATAELGTKRPSRRTYPLLALPVIGAGRGGGKDQAGAIVQQLLPVLYDFTQEHPVDIALVMQDPAQYAAAQSARTRLKGENAWPTLPAPIRDSIDDLARRANRQELVLFLGAGVSKAAGLPTWKELLNSLGGEKLASDREFVDLSELDKARVIQGRLDGDRAFRKEVAKLLRASRYSLAHGFLAALPTREVVTTNYDTLFEMASAAINRPVDVLPYDQISGNRWLLKLHGCVSKPDQIVLTREDYLRYDVQKGALAGLVQGLLITRHMLFVGFSMNDDNFHRIADEVRRAVQREPFGTCLSVAENRLLQEVWEKDLRWVGLGSLPESARMLEIVLDRLAAKTVVSAHHLFDKNYEATLSDADKELRNRLTLLRDLVSSTSEENRQNAAWAEVEKLLERLGLR